MATLSESLTLLEINALISANSIKIGKIYRVTDKGWVLFGIDINKLNSYSPLKITNGDTLPIGIEPDFLIIDTGVINYDIYVRTGNPVILCPIAGYLLYDVTVKVNIDENGTGIGNINAVDFTLSENWFETNINPYAKLIRSVPILQSDTAINWNQLSAQGVDANNTIRFLLEFNKNLF